MIKIDYIEEVGQYYYQCVVEIQFMNFVCTSIPYTQDNFYNIKHNGTTIKKRRTGKQKTFNFTMS